MIHSSVTSSISSGGRSMNIPASKADSHRSLATAFLVWHLFSLSTGGFLYKKKGLNLGAFFFLKGKIVKVA